MMSFKSLPYISFLYFSNLIMRLDLGSTIYIGKSLVKVGKLGLKCVAWGLKVHFFLQETVSLF